MRLLSLLVHLMPPTDEWPSIRPNSNPDPRHGHWRELYSSHSNKKWKYGSELSWDEWGNRSQLETMSWFCFDFGKSQRRPVNALYPHYQEKLGDGTICCVPAGDPGLECLCFRAVWCLGRMHQSSVSERKCQQTSGTSDTLFLIMYSSRSGNSRIFWHSLSLSLESGIRGAIRRVMIWYEAFFR